ncbi:hypothetical protein TNIN_485331 [Trichonephila inaurata madagascariensis]|uniref:Uncharacterized protein n=1 Tax=Trichonephila inaurata madagascariensis TaxID=2747483 RepID=A0A8X6MCK8_9ARAC|nr:hypothetical protein TNIN_485331 [Trichonephila inaurata madagascariensis]
MVVIDLQFGVSGRIGNSDFSKDYSFALIFRVGRRLLDKWFSTSSYHGHRVVLLVEGGVSVSGGHRFGHGVVF